MSFVPGHGGSPGAGSDDSSQPRRDAKVTAPGLRTRKLSGVKFTALTAYDYPTALIVDSAGVDVLLVGDSLANVVLGYDSTLPLELDELLAAVRAVRRGTRRALLVADLPFGSYQVSDERAVESAVRCLKSGAEAVKLEGGRPRAALVRRLVESGIPTMGHIGLTPQSVHAMGGYRVQGRDVDAARELVEDARALSDAGAFAIVLEGIPSRLAAEITAAIEAPTIGIGAGPSCDGQILVLHDVLGLLPGRKPKFVRQYADLHQVALDAVRAYCEDVVEGRFPTAKESYGSPEGAFAEPPAHPGDAVAPRAHAP